MDALPGFKPDDAGGVILSLSPKIKPFFLFLQQTPFNIGKMEKTGLRVTITAIMLVFALAIGIYVAYALRKAKEDALKCITPLAPLTMNISKWPFENCTDPKPIGIKTSNELSYMAAVLQLLLSTSAVVDYFKKSTFNDSSLVVISGLSAFIKEHAASNANSVDMTSFDQAILTKTNEYHLVFDNNLALTPGSFIGWLVLVAEREVDRLNANPTNTNPGANPFDMFESEFENKYKCQATGCNKSGGSIEAHNIIRLDLNGKSMKEIAPIGTPAIYEAITCDCNGITKEMLNEQPNFMVKAPVYFLFELINPTKVTLGKDSPLSDVINIKGLDYKLTGVISNSKVGEFITYTKRGKDWYSFNGEAVSSIDMAMSNDIGTAVVVLYTRIDP